MSGTKPGNALRLRMAYYADPTTRCAFCGLTWSEYAEVYGERLAAWQVSDDAVPVHRKCSGC